MTEFHVEVVRIGSVEKHPNADSLSITRIHGGYPVCFRTGEFAEGDLAVYIPVDAVAPDKPEWEFLGPGLRNHRIRAKKLRGVFSMGLLSKAPDGSSEGEDVAELLGFRRYEDVVDESNAYKGAPRTDGLQVPAPTLLVMPRTYDIEGFRRYGRSLFTASEDVVVTEKIHGQNFRAVFTDKLHIGSRTRWLDTNPETNTWAKVAQRYDLAEKLARYPHLVFFGESYGNNSDMPYGVERHKTGDALAIFDVFDSNRGTWLDYDSVVAKCDAIALPMAPLLVRYRFDYVEPMLPALAEGPTTIGRGGHVREGWVIKPSVERWDSRLGRVILKMHGEGYLTRKGG
jgi:RNA ligase (TIGR02306 family)